MADGYAKIWIDTPDDPWFITLNALQRGLWLQLIILAKKQSDTGHIVFKNWTAAAQQLGSDRSVTARSLLKFQQELRISIKKGPKHSFVVTLLNYQKHQRDRRVGDTSKSVQSLSINRLTNQTRPDKIREEGAPAFAKAEDPQEKAIEYIDKYRDRIKINCDQKGYVWARACQSLSVFVDWCQVTEGMSAEEKAKRIAPMDSLVERWLFRDRGKLRTPVTEAEDKQFRDELTRICNRKPELRGMTKAQEDEWESKKHRSGESSQPEPISAILSRAMKG